MRLATLPLNALEGTRPALGRQFVGYPVAYLRSLYGDEIASLSFFAQIDTEEGPKTAMINFSDTFLERGMLDNMFEQTGAEKSLDGLIEQTPEGFKLNMRVHAKGTVEPVREVEWTFSKSETLDRLHELKLFIAETAGLELPEEVKSSTYFGTKDPEAFLRYLEGHDALSYVQQSEGQVSPEFDAKAGFDSLLAALDIDPNFREAIETLAALARLCTQYRIGSAEIVINALGSAIAKLPEETEFYVAHGDLLSAMNNPVGATDAFEKGLRYHEKQFGDDVSLAEGDRRRAERSLLYARLGASQFAMGMPVNAERNLRKASELEMPPKPSLSLLSTVLHATGRGHEALALLRDYVTSNPADEQGHVRLAMALLQNEKVDDAKAAFEDGLIKTEGNPLIKRYYAPLLVAQDSLDQAMDFYEDCLEEAPNDIPLLMEYAQTLDKADRSFEVPPVLQTVLASNPNLDTRAQVQGWLLELEQPKRAEAVMKARQKLQDGDPEGALKDLKPLRTWLADYWKLWSVLASAYNVLNQSAEAEEAAARLLQIYPGCEPGYFEMLAALSGQEKFEDAYQLMLRAQQLFPQSPGIVVNLALAAYRAGHREEARNIARQIREAVGPNDELEGILAEIEKG